MSAPPTPSLAPFVREYPKTAPEGEPHQSCMHMHAQSLADSAAVSTPDADPEAVLHLWKEMGRIAPHFMRKESWPAESAPCMPAREMRYQPNDIFEEVQAAEHAGNLVQLFAQPKLAAVATGIAAGSVQANACAGTPSPEDSREQEEEQHVKFSMHGEHAAVTAQDTSSRLSGRSSLAGDVSAECSAASGVQHSDSMCMCCVSCFARMPCY